MNARLEKIHSIENANRRHKNLYFPNYSHELPSSWVNLKKWKRGMIFRPNEAQNLWNFPINPCKILLRRIKSNRNSSWWPRADGRTERKIKRKLWWRKIYGRNFSFSFYFSRFKMWVFLLLFPSFLSFTFFTLARKEDERKKMESERNW